ncbi:hypothetical protein D049_1134B, partial [Vibrio parahaemolyticus VPTS-2010]
NLQLSVVSERK